LHFICANSRKNLARKSNTSTLERESKQTETFTNKSDATVLNVSNIIDTDTAAQSFFVLQEKNNSKVGKEETSSNTTINKYEAQQEENKAASAALLFSTSNPKSDEFGIQIK
jgi:hypothetical protein